LLEYIISYDKLFRMWIVVGWCGEGGMLCEIQ
jgi:hypothetical protein